MGRASSVVFFRSGRGLVGRSARGGLLEVLEGECIALCVMRLGLRMRELTS